MGDLTFRPPTLGAVQNLADKMRPADRAEIAAAFGHSGTVTEIADYVANSADAWACYAPEGLMCLFGIARWPRASALAPVGHPWMLGTPVVSKHARGLVKATRAYLGEMRKDFPILVNFIDARNRESLRYMEVCGATIHPAEPYGVAGLPFHRFSFGL